MPAVVNKTLGSLKGTRLELGWWTWPRSAKNSMNARRASSLVVGRDRDGIAGDTRRSRRITARTRAGDVGPWAGRGPPISGDCIRRPEIGWSDSADWVGTVTRQDR